MAQITDIPVLAVSARKYSQHDDAATKIYNSYMPLLLGYLSSDLPYQVLQKVSSSHTNYSPCLGGPLPALAQYLVYLIYSELPRH